jgi:hypothetical protein
MNAPTLSRENPGYLALLRALRGASLSPFVPACPRLVRKVVSSGRLLVTQIMGSVIVLSIGIALATALLGCSPMVYTHGVPNLAQVDPNIYRSGEPNEEGWHYIQQLAAGKKIHVIKLNFIGEGSDAVAMDLGMDVVYVPIQPEGDQDVWDDLASTFKSPDEANVNHALTVMSGCLVHPDTDFCVVHCTHGQDRTGYLVGRFRVEHDGWSKSKAYSEMRAHNFHWELHGIADAWEDWTPPKAATKGL